MTTTRDPAPVPARLRAWLAVAIGSEASDLHLTAGYPPTLRLHGDLEALPEPALTGPEIDQLLGGIGPADVARPAPRGT